jgi:CDP-diacylglycerol--glycerol-3-phosphate 3-phosphatidyltransferase
MQDDKTKKTIFWAKLSLEKVDAYKDGLLFLFIKKYWPRKILPNHLTALRIVLAFFIFILLLLGSANRFTIVFAFVIAALLDLFDGAVARALDKKTNLGAFLDPVADKILIIPIAVYVLVQNHFWLLVFLILPEIISGLFVAYNLTKKITVKVNIFSKTKMVLESFAFAIILLNFPAKPHEISIVLLYLAIFFAFLGLIFNMLISPPKRISNTYVKTL